MKSRFSCALIFFLTLFFLTNTAFGNTAETLVSTIAKVAAPVLKASGFDETVAAKITDEITGKIVVSMALAGAMGNDGEYLMAKGAFENISLFSPQYPTATLTSLLMKYNTGKPFEWHEQYLEFTYLKGIAQEGLSIAIGATNPEVNYELSLPVYALSWNAALRTSLWLVHENARMGITEPRENAEGLLVSLALAEKAFSSTLSDDNSHLLNSLNHALGQLITQQAKINGTAITYESLVALPIQEVKGILCALWGKLGFLDKRNSDTQKVFKQAIYVAARLGLKLKVINPEEYYRMTGDPLKYLRNGARAVKAAKAFRSMLTGIVEGNG